MTPDTIFARASGAPPAAIAIIRVSGPRAHAAGQALAGALADAGRAVLRNLRHGSEVLDRALVLRFDAPASATGDDLVEFHCHGGRAVVDGVLHALAGIDGLRIAQAGEFTRRAFENGRIDLTEAEGLADLLEAETEDQRRAALALAEGGLRRQVEKWQSQVVALSARAEAAIDYDEEDGLGLDPDLPRDCGVLAAELEDWLLRPRVEPLQQGIKVVLAGPPNSGKSSLLNAIAGQEKAIVSSAPGTTRDVIEAPLAIGGVPYLLIDTAGLRDTDEPVERMGVERAQRSVQAADILLWLGDPDDAPAHRRLVWVHARSDAPDRAEVPAGSLAVSAMTGAGVAELLGQVAELASDLLPTSGTVALNRRQASAIAQAAAGLNAAEQSTEHVIVAEGLREARGAFDRLTGRAGTEDLLDALFGRFCLGK